MANCQAQEYEVTMLVEDSIEGALELLSRKPLNDAIKMAQQINNSHFYGNSVIQVSENKISREDGVTEVYFNQQAKDKAIQDKIDSDNRIELAQRERELQEGRNFEMDYPDYDDLVDSQTTYDEFNYANVLSNKLILKQKLEKQRDLLKNKNNDRKGLLQIEELNDLIRRLHGDIKTLQGGEEVLSAYLDSINRDIKNVHRLLDNPTLENMQAVNNYLETLKLFVSKEKLGFLQKPLSEIKDEDSKVWDKLTQAHRDIKLLEDEADHKTTEALKNAIQFHLEQQDKYANWSDDQLKEEVERLFEAQMNAKKDSVSLSKRQFITMDGQEENNILISALYRVYADALAMNNNKEERKKLSDLKEKVEGELKKMKRTIGTGFRKRADQSIFLRKSDSVHQLIGKFSSEWVSFKKEAEIATKTISDILYKPNKSTQEIRDIDEHFKKLNDNVDFIDVTRIPEIISDPVFDSFKNSFRTTQEADAYKAELIKKIGQREYDKAVREQKNKIHGYEIFKDLREARLRDKFKLEPHQNIEDHIPEKDWNTHLNYLFSKSPFIFAENYHTDSRGNRGTNQVSKLFYVNGNPFYANTHADMEFISYTPKKAEHFDADFAAIEGNDILRQAWTHMANLVEYNNKNGFNRNPDNLTEYSLASQAKRMTRMSPKMIGTLPKRILRAIHKGLSTSRYESPHGEKEVAGQITNVDQEIDRLYSVKIKAYRNPTPAEIEKVQKEAKDAIMSAQNEDLIDNILASTQITETFKATREVENQLKFLKKALDKTDSTGVKELASLFMERKLYQINNRANFNEFGKSFSFNGDTAWARFYTDKEKEVRKAVKETIKEMEKQLKLTSKPATINELKKDISDMKAFLETGGMVITPGSIIEGIVVKFARIAAFSLNASAQTVNMVMGKTNAREVDGRQDFWAAGVYQAAVSFSRKWKNIKPTEKHKREADVGELLLNRLQIFQNSANELFKLEQSRAASTIGAVMENPMNFVSEVEKTIQRPQIFAMMSEVFIEGPGGKVPMFDHVNGTFPAFQKGKDGSLELAPGFDTTDNINTFLNNNTQKYANLFGEAGKFPKGIARINGDYRTSGVYMYEKYIATAMAMMFKRWSVETIRKKFNVLERLGKNEHTGLGISSLVMTGAAFGFATGAVVLPGAIIGSLAVYTWVKGKDKTRANLARDVDHLISAQNALTNVKVNPINRIFMENIRLAGAAFVQSLGMIIDPFTGKQVIHADMVKSIFQTKKYNSIGEPLTADEIREVKEDLYFMTTAMASTIKLLAMRYLVMLFLYPDDDEEEAHKQRIKANTKNMIDYDSDEGLSINFKNKFFDRLIQDPDTTMYYLLENMLSGTIDDINMIVNPDGLVRAGDMMGLAKFGTFAQNTQDWINGDGDYQSGQNQGDNKLFTNILRYYTPAAIKDGLALGFGTKSQKDFDAQNIIDQSKVSLLEKVNKKRLSARSKKKKKMMQSKQYVNYTTAEKEKEINRELLKEFPVIRESDLNEQGKLEPFYSYKWESYYK